ncbi:MAG: cytochrome c [Anaerolineaceae bacterium]|nr:MAG: cytochrome c [Anaerolineaceae bacterium]
MTGILIFGGGKLKPYSFFIMALLLTLILSACGGTPTPAVSFAPVPPEFAGKTSPLGADAADAGALNYATYCESCHGASGLGDGPAAAALNPPAANLLTVASQVEDDYLFWRISEGKMGTAMVGWGSVLNEEQIWQVVAYIRTLK